MAVAAALGRCFIRRTKSIYGTFGSVKLTQRLASSGSGSDIPDPFKPPPIREFTGPDYEDQGWKDDGLGLGDYPNIKARPAESRDPYLKYFDQQERRHFGEPLHEDEDILSIWAPDTWEKSGIPPGRAAFQLGVMFSILGSIIYYSECVEGEDKDPMAPKEYPFNNLYLELGNDPKKEPENYKFTKMPMNYPY